MDEKEIMDENIQTSMAVVFGLMNMGKAISDTRRFNNQRNVYKIGKECGTHCLSCLERIMDGMTSKCKNCRKSQEEGAAMLGGFIGMGDAIKNRIKK